MRLPDADREWASSEKKQRPYLRGFALFALLMSTAGDEVLLVALTLRAAADTNSTFAVASILSAALAPAVIFAPLTGYAVDRSNPRKLISLALLMQAVVASAFVVADSQWLIVVLTLTLGSLAAVVQPALFSLIPSIAAKDRWAKANAVVDASRNVGIFIGPFLGATLVATVGADVAFLVDAASFGVAAAAALLILPSKQGDSITRLRPTGSWRVTSALFKQPTLRVTLTALFITVLTSSMINVALVFYVDRELNSSAFLYGFLLSIWAFGIVLGPFMFLRHMSGPALPKVALIAAASVGTSLLFAGIFRVVAVVAALFFLGGCANGVQNVSMRSLIAHVVPGTLLGRAYAAYSAVINAAVLIGYFMAGGLSPNASGAVFVAAGSTCASTALIGAANLRHAADEVVEESPEWGVI